jgi:hypothetical protein
MAQLLEGLRGIREVESGGCLVVTARGQAAGVRAGLGAGRRCTCVGHPAQQAGGYGATRLPLVDGRPSRSSAACHDPGLFPLQDPHTRNGVNPEQTDPLTPRSILPHPRLSCVRSSRRASASRAPDLPCVGPATRILIARVTVTLVTTTAAPTADLTGTLTPTGGGAGGRTARGADGQRQRAFHGGCSNVRLQRRTLDPNLNPKPKYPRVTCSGTAAGELGGRTLHAVNKRGVHTGWDRQGAWTP